MGFSPALNKVLSGIEVPKLQLPDGWVFNCDNRLIFEALPDECIDLIITDPPYKDYQSNRPVKHPKVKKILQSDFDLPFFIEQSARVLKPGAHFYCWCDHLTFPWIVSEIERHKGKWKIENETQVPCHYLTYKNCLVWIKNNHGAGDLKGNYAPQHEFVIFGCKGERGRKLNGTRPSNIFDARKVSNYRHNHSTAKPVEILKKFIEVSSDEGEVVLDCYAGSMSVGEACLETKRDFIGIEINPEHYSTGIGRIKKTIENIN